ncbi:hypothetical protein E2I00_013490, partial [Balaenoptera physalus]
ATVACTGPSLVLTIIPLCFFGQYRHASAGTSVFSGPKYERRGPITDMLLELGTQSLDNKQYVQMKSELIAMISHIYMTLARKLSVQKINCWVIFSPLSCGLFSGKEEGIIIKRTITILPSPKGVRETLSFRSLRMQ